MSDIDKSESTSSALVEKPVQDTDDDVKFPPFPEPNDDDFDDDIIEEEREHYKNKFKDLNTVKTLRLHCTSCDKHLGSSTRNDNRMRAHPMLRTLVCRSCHTFYNSGEFDKGDDGSELYCRWCGQGGQVYCCSDCPHVFCAKCIKRNFGMSKIKEIENTDDWKCFKCNSTCLWDMRATCWALLRYCDLKNSVAAITTDADLSKIYEDDCSMDYSECCKKNKKRDSKKKDEVKKELIVKKQDSITKRQDPIAKKQDPIVKKQDLTVRKQESTAKKNVAAFISKIPPTIQVKKFAAWVDEAAQTEKKATKRPASPKNHGILRTHMPIKPPQTPLYIPPVKKVRMQSPILSNVLAKNNAMSYQRIKPKPSIIAPIPVIMSMQNAFNGFNNGMSNDNINLSLDSLTQGLDMSSIMSMGNENQDDVVCTPDFPMEPLCEVSEDINDDDVQCITPPVTTNKNNHPPPLVPRVTKMTPDISEENIIQMTEDDVTVNAVTGGLKFRIDPQTLSSNNMYRLPDGRIFAIHPNPNVPGGYSATIVAISENKQPPAKGVPCNAKVTSHSSPNPRNFAKPYQQRKSSVKVTQTKEKAKEKRKCDTNVPIEWFRYNVIDAVDALEFSIARLRKLRDEATARFLRTRTSDEMSNLHKRLERLLNTSSSRFLEIRDTLNKEYKQYTNAKNKQVDISEDEEDDDDDVEILPNTDEGPIFIDENSVDSITHVDNGTQEVDLTCAASSENNDSAENLLSPTPDQDPLSIPPKDQADCDSTKQSVSNEENNSMQDLDLYCRESNVMSKKQPTEEIVKNIDSVSDNNSNANDSVRDDEIHILKDANNDEDSVKDDEIHVIKDANNDEDSVKGDEIHVIKDANKDKDSVKDEEIHKIEDSNNDEDSAKSDEKHKTGDDNNDIEDSVKGEEIHKIEDDNNVKTPKDELSKKDNSPNPESPSNKLDEDIVNTVQIDETDNGEKMFSVDNKDKTQDDDMTEEMIESLLGTDSVDGEKTSDTIITDSVDEDKTSDKITSQVSHELIQET